MTKSEHIPSAHFDYEIAFGRTLGWVSQTELHILRRKRVAIAGLGGVGGSHALMLARLGIGAFHLADFDRFDLANMNRQAGAFSSTIGAPKCAIIANMVADINPEAQITPFPKGITDSSIDAFLDGVDLFVDGLDFFVLDIRRKLFARAREKGIPAITVAPLGLGSAWLIFTPDSMSFEEYFRFDGASTEQQYVRFMIGLAPAALHRPALVDPSRVDFSAKAGPSTPMACGMASAILGAEALKVLLKRGSLRPAPWFHQFDPHGLRFKSSRTQGGNAHPVRRIKIALAQHWIKRIAPREDIYASSVAEDAPTLYKILDLARWAPSGDNEQPWRFDVLDDHHIRVHLHYEPGANIYEYANGRPIWLAAGGLLETLRIAASKFGFTCDWTIENENEPEHIRLFVTFKENDTVPASPLAPFIMSRTVDRRPYRRDRLDAQEKKCLEAALSDTFYIEWFESRKDRWAATCLNMLATRLRLTIEDCHKVHQKAIHFENNHAAYGLPAKAVGLDPMTIAIMRWANAKWSRSKILNRFLGGAWAASLQLDILPGLNCAAHFFIRWREDRPDRPVSDWIEAGRTLQRFWLTAESLGLSLQPSFAPLIFGHGAAHQHRWSERRTAEKAQAIGQTFEALLGCSTDAVVFPGRIGRGRSLVQSRSVRQPLSA
ncbi:hypothetical protein JCM17845_08630 [Iodidimonas gelatinilytica]|uniref:THIF-type NAD/FAD binding fold domain-containing protein n=1 Tax=Iodidimonas gelatinilytica TaxID=1236966 RepID=A0A5A7MYV2_9PROT|nr:ThiF family adenylyltransferase [Iodidimonas gelatinilytica]GER00240.1 hypothetical protein JCM17845_08630 [Iodidimonas gelatinilytica]